MKKFIPVVAISGLLFVIGFISTSVRNNNIAYAASPCKSCAKAADSGKKQSTSKKICSAITGILKNEIGKTKNKTKLDILKGGLDYANDVCDSGGSPDLAKITKGLPEKDKARISQKTNAALFDGVADRTDKDFGPSTSKTAATLTGTGGVVADLKSSGPDIPKLNQVSEFSLAKPSSLLTSTKTATAASVKATKLNCQNGLEPMYCTCLNGKYIGTLCMEDCYAAVVNLSICPAGAGIGAWLEKYKNKILNWAWSNKTIKRYLESIETVGNWIADKYHELKGDKKCGNTWFNPKTNCCTSSKTVGKYCGEVCYDPAVDCCENNVKDDKCGKKCARIKKRLDDIKATISGFEKGQTPEQTLGGIIIPAKTFCLPGVPLLSKGIPYTRFYQPFYDLVDSEIQQAIVAHENIHKEQCRKYGNSEYLRLLKEDLKVIEGPAWVVARDTLQPAYDSRCKTLRE